MHIPLWNADDGAAPPIQELFGKIISHVYVYPPGVRIRFTDSTTMEAVATTLPSSLYIGIKIATMSDDLARQLPGPTNFDELKQLVGLAFTGMNQNRFEFGAIGLELDAGGLSLVWLIGDAVRITYTTDMVQ